MVGEFTEPGCYSKALVAVNLALAFVDIAIAVLAFYQVSSILSQSPHFDFSNWVIRFAITLHFSKGLLFGLKKSKIHFEFVKLNADFSIG